jgi:hypothetical protein
MELNSIKRKSFTLLLSVFFHLLIMIIALLIHYLIAKEDYPRTEYMSLNLENYVDKDLNDKYPIEQKSELKENNFKKNLSDNLISANSVLLFDSLIQVIDSTDLDSIYNEDSRGVSIKFPAGWTFLDQRVNSKFDGVTFWPPNQSSDNIPYIHLEVVEKELFSISRYEFSSKQSDFIWYFNSPEIIDDFVHFEIYIQTQKDVDYKIKLIVKGLTNFEGFYPKFLAMLRSLKLQKGYFDIF